ERVPDGIQVDAIVTDEELLRLKLMGAKQVAREQPQAWALNSAQTAADTLLRPPAPTVRVVRADYFTTKGQGFLYVEARTTKGAQTTPVVAMTLESDTGEGTAFVSPRTMSRFVDSGEYMFHRNLFKVDIAKRPDQIRVTSTINGVIDGQATGKVSDWLEDVTPLTADPSFKADFVDDYKTPQQLYGRFEEIAQQFPDIA